MPSQNSAKREAFTGIRGGDLCHGPGLHGAAVNTDWVGVRNVGGRFGLLAQPGRASEVETDRADATGCAGRGRSLTFVQDFGGIDVAAAAPGDSSEYLRRADAVAASGFARVVGAKNLAEMLLLNVAELHE